MHGNLGNSGNSWKPRRTESPLHSNCFVGLYMLYHTCLVVVVVMNDFDYDENTLGMRMTTIVMIMIN